MGSTRSLSIRGKLTLMIMAGSGLALLLASAAFILYDSYTFRTAKIQDVATLAEIVGANCTGALTYQDANSATEVLSALASKKQISEASIYDRQGQVFARYLRGGTSGAFSPPAAQKPGIFFEKEHPTGN